MIIVKIVNFKNCNVCKMFCLMMNINILNNCNCVILFFVYINVVYVIKYF